VPVGQYSQPENPVLPTTRPLRDGLEQPISGLVPLALFDVPLIMDSLGIDRTLADVVELGCGYGTFSLPVVRRISGTLATFDIEQDMLARTRARAAGSSIRNLACDMRDVRHDGFSCS